MSLKLDILTTVFSHGHTASSLRLLSHYFSPNFTYKCPIRGTLNFEEFCQNMEIVSSSCEFQIKSLESFRDHYKAEFEITMIHSDIRKASVMAAQGYFHFKDDLIQSIIPKMKPSPIQMAYMLMNKFSFTKPSKVA